MKRFIVAAIAGTMILGMTAFSDGQTANLNSIHVKVNGNLIDEPNILYADRSYVPMRKVFESIGCTVEWEEATSTAKITGQIVKYEDAGILKTYDEEYAILKERYDAILEVNKDNEDETARILAEFETLAAQLKEKYDAAENNVTAADNTTLPQWIDVVDQDGTTVRAETNTINVFANDTQVKAPNILFNNRTYIPLRAVAEELGCAVEWEDSTATALITGDIKHETTVIVYESYDDALAALNAKYEPKITKAQTAYDKAYQEAFNYSKAAGGTATSSGDPVYAAAQAADELKVLDDTKAEYEEKLIAIRDQFGVTE